MKTHWKIVGAATLLALQGAVSAQGLGVEQYVGLSIERLELIEARLQQGRSPSAEEMSALWQRYGTSEEEYVAYRGRNPAAVDDYLAGRPEESARIDDLAARIGDLVSDGETDGKEVPAK